jgi:small subunit ribosomal protein S13
MLYIIETKLPENKSVFFALTYIYGIGKNTSFFICKKLGFSLNLKIKDLTQEQVIDITKCIDSLNLILNNESYRGLRRIRGLPVRGQRTHTNAKSARKNVKY